MEVCEKIQQYGTLTLSNAELLEVILGKKGAKKLDTLLQQYDLKDTISNDDDTSNVLRIANLDYDHLKYKGNLTNLETSRLMACVELGIRIGTQGRYRSSYFTQVSIPEDLANYLMPRLRFLNHEIFGVAIFNAKNEIIGTKIISKGTLTSAAVDIRDIFSYAILNSAASLAVYHNHPSGSPEPSKEDIELTHVINASSLVLGIPLIDHIIIGDGSFVSLRERNLLEPTINK